MALRRDSQAAPPRRRRRPWSLAIGLLGALALAAPAPATAGSTLVGADGGPLHGPYQGWVNRALMPTPPGRVTIDLTGCPVMPDADGCVLLDRPDTIYLLGTARQAKREYRLRRYRLTLNHELGHVFDVRLLDDDERRSFSELVGRAGRGWWDGDEPAAELFAEAYAYCSAYRGKVRRSARLDAHYGYRPSGGRHRAVCRLVHEAARDREPAPQPPPQQPPSTEHHVGGQPAPIVPGGPV